MAQVRREISGNDILLFIDPLGGTNYKLIVCLTTNSLERTTNEIDASSKCGPSTLPGNQTIKIPFEFHDVLDVATGELSEGDLHNLWAAKTIFSWKFGPAMPGAGDLVYTGKGFLGQLNTTAAQNSPVVTSSSIGVQGTITQINTSS